MRKIAFAIALISACSVSHAQFESAKDLYLTKSFKDSPFKKINAETTHGNIFVSVVPATEAKIEVYVRSSNSDVFLSKEEIQKKLDEYYSIDISVSGDMLSAIVRRTKDFINGQTSLNVSLVIYAAKNTASQLKTSHGNVDITGMEASEDITTSHGNIHTENVSGKLTAQTSHGNISVSGAKDDIDL